MKVFRRSELKTILNNLTEADNSRTKAYIFWVISRGHLDCLPIFRSKFYIQSLSQEVYLRLIFLGLKFVIFLFSWLWKNPLIFFLLFLG